MKYLIHVEQIYNDEVWNNLFKFITTHDCKLFLLPPNYDLFKANFGYQGTEEYLNEIFEKRYAILKQKKVDLGIHIHFCLHPEKMPIKIKNKIFEDNFNWYTKRLGQPEHIAFGWFKYDKYLENKCKEHNLKIYHFGINAITLHDYDLPLSINKILIRWMKDMLSALI